VVDESETTVEPTNEVDEIETTTEFTNVVEEVETLIEPANEADEIETIVEPVNEAEDIEITAEPTAEVDENEIAIGTTEQEFDLQAVLKNRQIFSDYVETKHAEISVELTKGYPHSSIHASFVQLTQNIEGFGNLATLPKIAQYVFWYVTNEREEILNSLKVLNAMSSANSGFFVIKAELENDEIVFKTILKPEIKLQLARSRVVNKETPTKNLQMEYWQLYSEICDTSECPDVQIVPAQKHWQYIKTGKAHSQLLLTLNVQDSLATVEFVNNKDEEKLKFNKLLDKKSEIETALGELEWHELQGKQSSKLKTVIKINNIQDRDEWKTIIEEQIKIAENFRLVIPQYL
jgi:hypothetical protein